jgi:GrpB-like predicted nucleotidyltransferase (UPF0157 family)
MQILLVPYSPLWKVFFVAQQQQLLLLGNNLVAQIEHIGSTSIEGLAAKPIVDILVGLTNFERDATQFVNLMQQHNYTYNNTFEHLMPFRRFFTQQTEEMKFNIHTVQIGDEFWQRHLLFRDYLRQNPQKTADYLHLKQTLAAQNWESTGDYADAKTPFIRQTESDAKIYFNLK